MDTDTLVTALERIVVGAVGLTSRALSEAAPGIDLTFPQWRTLLILGENPSGARVGGVAARTGVTLPATGRLLRRLERRGMVVLAPDEADRRATRARLTPQGQSLRAAILEYRLAALRRVASQVAQTAPLASDAATSALATAFGVFA